MACEITHYSNAHTPRRARASAATELSSSSRSSLCPLGEANQAAPRSPARPRLPHQPLSTEVGPAGAASEPTSAAAARQFRRRVQAPFLSPHVE